MTKLYMKHLYKKLIEENLKFRKKNNFKLILKILLKKIEDIKIKYKIC
jgi:hypothetical protein